MPAAAAASRTAASTGSSASLAQMRASARSRSRSSRPLISGVNSIAAPPAAASSHAPRPARRHWRRDRSRSAPGRARSSSAAEQRIEPAVALERVEIVGAADMAPSMKICGTVVRPLARWIISARFGPPMVMSYSSILDALGVEQPLGARAISAEHLGVDFDARHPCLLAARWGRAALVNHRRRGQRAPSRGCSPAPRRRASAPARRHWRWRRWYRRRRPG